jgi:hypothetical protein
MQPQQPRPGRQKLRASAPHRTDQPAAQRAPSCTYTYVHMAASTRRRHGAAAPGEWAAVSGAGAWRVEEVGKHQLMRRTGLPARDLRALDPALQFYYHPCSIVGRDRAVVVNLERARAVITATEVLVPAPRDPAVAPLFRSLRARLVASSAPAASPASAPPPEAFVSLRPCPALLASSVSLRWSFFHAWTACLLKQGSILFVCLFVLPCMKGGGRGRGGWRRCTAAEPRWSRRRQGRASVCTRQAPAVRVQGARGVPRVLMQVT